MPDTEQKPNEVELIREALKNVMDPHIGLSVVDLGMIREIVPGDEDVQVNMILTTPFCPLAKMITSQVQQEAERIANRPVKVNLGTECWTPALMKQQG